MRMLPQAEPAYVPSTRRPLAALTRVRLTRVHHTFLYARQIVNLEVQISTKNEDFFVFSIQSSSRSGRTRDFSSSVS